MKIAVWILSEYKPQVGGGFSLYDKIIQSIDDYRFSDDIDVCFTGHRPASAYHFKKEYIPINSLGLFNNLISKISHKIKFIGKLEGKILKNRNVDLIYYPVQGLKKVHNFPFAAANWDTGHLSGYAFPEVAMNGKFEYREKWYSKEIYKALMVFAESEAGKEELLAYTKLNPDRIGIVPLFPGGVVETLVSETDQNAYLKQNNLASHNYFFYPAQFWAHKNHYNLLLAFKDIVSAHPDMKMVFTGSDKGNKTYIQQVVTEFGLDKNVIFTGFVSNEEICTLYRNALALVMPSFIGATNMPLLEARMLNCPVLCSELKGHVEIMKDSAIYFRPDDAVSISNAMKRILSGNERSELLVRADRSLKETLFTVENALRMLNGNFIKLKSIRLSWGKNDQIF